MKYTKAIAQRLSQAFQAQLLIQAQNQGRELTPINSATATALLSSVEAALRDRNEDVAFRVCSAQTGTGKSMAALALMAAGFKEFPSFTAAIVVESVRQAEEFRVELSALVGPENVTCWTYAHDAKRDASSVKLDQGFLPPVVRNRDDMKSARLVISTHQSWIKDLRGKSRGLREFTIGSHDVSLSVPRSVIFVDEHPELIQPIEVTPLAVTMLRDRVKHHEPEHEWMLVLDRVVEQMNSMFARAGQKFVISNLIQPHEQHLFGNASLWTLKRYADDTLSPAAQDHEARIMSAAVKFLVSAARGCAFFHREPDLFIGYDMGVTPGPGHVLLDATAGLAGYVNIMPGMETSRDRGSPKRMKINAILAPFIGT